MIEIIAASIAAFAAILVWYLSSRDLSRKEKENKRREIRLNYLIDAYRKLESAANRPMTPDSEHARNIESAIADIQLFGSISQVEFAQIAAKTFAETGQVSFDDLLNDLRDDLRNELELDTLSSRRQILRIVPKKPNHKRLRSA